MSRKERLLVVYSSSCPELERTRIGSFVNFQFSISFSLLAGLIARVSVHHLSGKDQQSRELQFWSSLFDLGFQTLDSAWFSVYVATMERGEC